ncbi:MULTISPECIES: hypothetical protein [Amycolatopsis]|uniref:Uncharacterized protein n=1 Tax=Amycolatopsis albidoflavus TaxID=102226 RepID=A0ABW5I5P1_9PSEU
MPRDAARELVRGSVTLLFEDFHLRTRALKPAPPAWQALIDEWAMSLEAETTWLADPVALPEADETAPPEPSTTRWPHETAAHPGPADSYHPGGIHQTDAPELPRPRLSQPPRRSDHPTHPGHRRRLAEIANIDLERDLDLSHRLVNVLDRDGKWREPILAGPTSAKICANEY